MIYDPELLTFKESTHKYHYDGEHVSSVTTILGIIAKPQLIPWSAKIAAERFANDLRAFNVKSDYMSDEDIEQMRKNSARSFATDGKAGARLGTLVHESIEGHIVHSRKAPVLALGYVKAFESWWKKESKKYEIIAVEHRLFHPKFKYAGTTDLVLRHRITGTVKIVDYKTSKRSDYAPYGIYAEYLAQGAAYAEAWNATIDTRRDSCVEVTILNVADDGTYHAITRDTFDISQDFQVFRQAQVLRENLKYLESVVKPDKKAKAKPKASK